jgi:hypothetical protein
VGRYDPKTPSRFNSFNVTLFLVVSALVYGGAFYLPHFWSVWQLSSIMKTHCDMAYRNHSNEALFASLLKQSERVSMKVQAADFELERVPYSPEEMMAIAEDGRDLSRKRGKTMIIRFHKTVDAKWPLVNKWTKLSFRRTVESPLEAITW